MSVQKSTLASKKTMVEKHQLHVCKQQWSEQLEIIQDR